MLFSLKCLGLLDVLEMLKYLAPKGTKLVTETVFKKYLFVHGWCTCSKNHTIAVKT